MRNKFFTYFSLVFLYLVFSSCSDHFCDQLKSKLDKIECTDKSGCTVDMKDIFEGKWEYVYMFQGFNMPEDISKAIGFKYSGETIYDPTRLFLFVSQNKIQRVYETECYSINMDRILKNGYVKMDSSNSELILFTHGQGKHKKYILDFIK